MSRSERSPHALCALALLALGWISLPATATAQTPPTVVVVFEGQWEGALRGDVWADLGSMLRDRGIRLLAETDAPSTRLATVRIAAPASGSVRIAIEDQLTAKLVERALPLGEEEPDTWSTLIAAGGDELLRASWVELSMRSAPPPAQPPPPEVEHIVEEEITPPRDGVRTGASIRAELLAAEHAIAAGMSAGVVVAVHEHVELGVRASIDAIVPGSSARARVDGALVAGDLEIAAPLLGRNDRVQVALVGLGRLGAAWMRASAEPGWAGSDDTAFFALAGGGVRLGVRVETTRLELGAMFLAPLAGVRGSDGVDDVVALTGPLGLVELGVELWP